MLHEIFKKSTSDDFHNIENTDIYKRVDWQKPQATTWYYGKTKKSKTLTIATKGWRSLFIMSPPAAMYLGQLRC